MYILKRFCYGNHTEVCDKLLADANLSNLHDSIRFMRDQDLWNYTSDRDEKGYSVDFSFVPMESAEGFIVSALKYYTPDDCVNCPYFYFDEGYVYPFCHNDGNDAPCNEGSDF